MWGPTMSDHNWVLENLESYSAGGLNAEERERLESHLPECLSCSQALQDIRASDQQLESLFAPVRPRPGFEDRMISSLRTASAKNGFRLPMIGWIGASAAAAVVVGVVGASMERVVLHGSPMRPSGGMSAENDLKQLHLPMHLPLSSDSDNEAEYLQSSAARSPNGAFVSDKSRMGESKPVDKMAEDLSKKHLSELGKS